MRFHIVLFACLFFMAACLPPATQAQASVNFTTGTNILWGGGDEAGLQARFDRMKQLGLTEARVDWEWRAVESKKGVYKWQAMDKLVSLAAKNNISLLPIVHYAPSWALPSSRKTGYELAPREDAFAAYAKFLAAAIDRYGPGGNAPVPFQAITYWQVWNEPNNSDFWGPKPNAGSFVKLMKAVNAGLGTDRRNKVKLVHAGLSKADVAFVWQLWEVDAAYGKYFDIMALHPYFFSPNGGVRDIDAMDATDDSAAEAMGFVGSKHEGGFLGKVFNIQLFMTLKGSPKPIWITEIGFMAGSKNQWAVSENEETKLATKTLNYINDKLTTRGFGKGARKDLPANVQRVYWFTLDDYGFPDDTGNFGLYRMDGTARPLADVVKGFSGP